MSDPQEKHIRVGTRKSQLALIQTCNVIQMLRGKDPSLKFETLPMTTVGDQILDSALSKIGEKSLFTKELENALLKRQVDFVVHSLKDLPTTLPEGLVIGCVCKRDSPYDAVVMHPKHAGKTLKDLPSGSIIGTSSLRRAAQIKIKYPHLKIENIRGNLNTRFQKLAEKDMYDAIILAVAGLERMGWHSCISQALTTDECMYAVAQGAMAVECRADDVETLKLLRLIHDHESTLTCVAERAFLKELEGGCSVPVSTFTVLTDKKMAVHGGVFSIDGSEVVKHSVEADLDQVDIPNAMDPLYVGIHCQTPEKWTEYASACTAGVKLANGMIEMGAAKILSNAKAQTKKEIIEDFEKKKAAKEAQAGASASESSTLEAMS